MAFNYRTEYQRYRQYYTDLRRFYQRPVIKVSFFVLLSFFTVVFFSVFAIRPTITTIGKLIREIDDKRKINDTLANKLKALDALQGEILGLETEIPLIFAVLPSDSDLGRLTQALEYLAGQNGVTILSVNFQPVALNEAASKSQKADVVNFSFSAGGSFPNLARFLDEIERLDRLLVLNKVELVSGAVKFRAEGIETIVDVEGQGFFLKEAILE